MQASELVPPAVSIVIAERWQWILKEAYLLLSACPLLALLELVAHRDQPQFTTDLL